MSDFTHQQKDIPAYDAFREATVSLTRRDISLSEFTRILKYDAHFKQLRNDARSELKRIYDGVAKDLALPNIPVFLPVKKKVTTRGKAHSVCGSPTEIRVYPIEGVFGVSYDTWRPQDIGVCSKMTAFEILKHEIAHVITTHRNGEIEDHDESFVQAYDEINSYFKANGYEALIDPDLELWGCPAYSYAGREAAARKSKRYRTVSSTPQPQGCFTMLAVATLVVVSLLFLL